MTRHIPIDEAKALELRAFARTHLGMTFKIGATSEHMRAQIRAAWDKDHIVVGDDGPAAEEEAPPTGSPPPKPPGPSNEMAPGPTKAAPKIPIQINRTEEVGGDEPVPVSVNGVAMLIPRGQRVEVPEPYVEALKNAITVRYEQVDVDGQGRMEMVPREVPAYPFQIFQG